MSRFQRSVSVLIFSLLLACASLALAQNEGQAELDQATETKLAAQSLDDLNRVVDLIEKAVQKGLDGENTQFAQQLLGATLLQRGTLLGNVALQLGPGHARFAALREQALADIERGLKHAPEQPEILLLSARLNVLAGGDVEKAREAADKAMEMQIDDPRLRANLLTLQAALVDDPDEKRRLLNQAVQTAPTSAPALRTRALLRADRGEFEQALEDFNRALEIDPKHQPTYEAKAAVLAKLEQYDEAIATLDELEALNARSIAPMLQKARIHLLQGDSESALNELNRASQRDPSNLRILLLRAGVHEEVGKTSAALADLERALELQPNFPPAVRLRATLLADDDRIEEAIADLQNLKQAGPSDPLTLLQLGMLLSAAQKHAKAAEAYGEVLQLQPDNWLALRGRGDAVLNLGKHKEAIANYEKALEAKADSPGVLNNLAWVLATSPKDEVRDGPRAVKLATKASELTDHSQAHILSTVAAAHAETGDFEKALEWIDKGLAIAGEETREPLVKERESYEQKKPWRELLSPDDAGGK